MYRGNYISSVEAKKAKLDDVKGLFKYLGQTAIDKLLITSTIFLRKWEVVGRVDDE